MISNLNSDLQGEQRRSLTSPIQAEDDKLTYLKKCLTDLASRTLDTAAYLRVKRDVAQCSSLDKL